MAAIGLLTVVGGGIVTGVYALKNTLLKLKSEKDAANAQSDADRHRIDAEDIRLFRKELQEQVTELRRELDMVRVELREAQSQILKQNGMFVNVLYRLEGIMSLKEISKIEHEVKELIGSVREFLNVLPIGAVEHPERKNLLENRE